MQRNFFRGFLICLIPCLLAGYFAAFGKYRLGIDLAGGTILVYEINLERTKQRKEAEGQQAAAPAAAAAPAEGLSSAEMNQLAAQIKRRIDPADLKNVTVRPLGDSRVEIILPTGGVGAKAGLTAEEVEEVKRLISQMGVLEFRILANEADDAPGIDAARQLVEGKSQEELDARAVKGLPPEGPPEEFVVRIGDSEVKVRYVWVELAPEERVTLGLDNASEGRAELWNRMAEARRQNKTYRHQYPGGDAGDKVASMLLYSRDVKSAAWLAKEKADRERLEREGKAAEFNPKKVEYFVLTRVSPLDTLKVGGDITLTATSDIDHRTLNPAVAFTFNGAGAQQFGRMTERNKPTGQTIRTLAILLDEKVVSAPTLNAVITSRGQISGKFDRKSVDRLVHILRSGALSAELRERPVSENTIGPTLGADTIRRGTFSVGAAFACILVFMLIYYRFAGMVACLALLANLLLTVGFMVAVNAAFTLPGLAGIVLMLGMAVDANILIYERIREERNKGANLPTAIRNGYDRAFPTIIDTHLTSIFTAVVLYTFGNDQLKGFAIALTVGLVISLFTALYMTRLLFDYGMHRRWLTSLRMMRLFERPNLNPMKYRFVFFPATTALTVLGLAVFLYRGEDGLNVDFRGGTVYAGRLKDGEERALTRTADGKAGFRELLAEGRQKERLNVTDVRWVNKPPSGDVAAVNTYVFEVRYADNTSATVTLSQKPADVTGEVTDQKARELEEAVRARASALPDVSVEQVFLTGEDYPEGKSRYFTIRTTERQKELVQVAIDRLLRDDGKGLVAGATMNYKTPIDGPVVELTFDKPTSPSYMKDLLDREFRKAGAEEAATTFELAGVGEAVDGRYTVMRLDVSKSVQNFDQLRAGAPDSEARKTQLTTLQDVLRETKQAFDSSPEPERLEVFDSQLAAETRTKAFYAILASWVAVLLYLWFRFGNWTFGLAAVLCLIHDLCFTLGAIAACHYLFDLPGFSWPLMVQDFKIDLPAVAALLTLVGFSVNDTIVVFDRIREIRGKNPALTPQMINDSVNQTLSRTVLASLTVFLVVGVLYFFGGEGVHLFAFVMVVGVIVGTYSSIFVASPLLLFFGEGRGEAAAPTETPRTEEEAEVQA